MAVSMGRGGTQLLAIGLLELPMLNWLAGAASLDQIHRLENLINASGGETVVSAQSPPITPVMTRTMARGSTG